MKSVRYLSNLIKHNNSHWNNKLKENKNFWPEITDQYELNKKSVLDINEVKVERKHVEEVYEIILSCCPKIKEAQ